MTLGIGEGIERGGAPLRIEKAATTEGELKLNLLPKLTEELSYGRKACFVLLLQMLDILLQVYQIAI